MGVERYHLRIGETIATVIADSHYLPIAEDAVRAARHQITTYFERDPCFKISHRPITVHEDAPELIQHMAEVSMIARVGPMAAVAGAIAQYAVEQLVAAGADHVIFDNGGDIAMYLAYPAVVGLYTGPSGLNRLGLKVTETGTLLGLCTSSATVGHSFSYGNTDASVIYSDDVVLADAFATALGNMVTHEDPVLVRNSLNKIMAPKVRGAMVVIGDTIGTCGELPELVQAQVPYELISKG